MGFEMDPWGADTNRSNNAAFQPRKFTSYERDANGSDEAMFRRSNRWHSRFDQPDPYDGSYSLTDPQSFNRYAYVQNDPVNFVDPTGLWMTISGVIWLDGGGFTVTYTSDFGLSPGDAGFGPGGGGIGGNYSMRGGTGSDQIRYIWGWESNLEGGSRPTLLWFAIALQDPSHYDVNKIIRDAIDKKKREEKAEKDYKDCVNNNPDVKAFNEKLKNTHVAAPWGSARSGVGLGVRAAATGVVTTAGAGGLVFSFLLWGMTMNAPREKVVNKWRPTIKPILAACAKQAAQDNGLTFDFGLP
ncbi:MAG: RHS repeat-associated core domain-containing protein [Pyrinomonadaceae bacterium]